MAYTADDLRKMRERGTTRASSSDSKRKYTADDLMAMRGKSVQNETASLYDSYAKQAVSNTPKYRYNSLEQYDTALKESKPKNDFAKRVANAGINALNALSGIGLTGTNVTPIKNLPYNKEEMAYNDLKKERNLYAQEHMLDEYQKKYKTNADFVAKSHDRGMKETLDVLDSMRGDTMYSSLYENMTDDEKAMANYLSNISESDPKAFEDYMMNMRASVNKREFDKKVAEKNAYMNADGLKKVGRGAALSAESVGENTLASIGTAGEYLESYLGGWNPDPYGGASGLGNLAMAEREAVSKDMGEVGSFVYNTGMSVVDSAIGARLFGKGYSVLMGTNAFNTSYKDLYERGASKDEILLGSLTAGAAETVFEKISLENLLKPRGIKDVRAFAKAWLEQAGVEASEEFFTEMTNIITDELTQGANSEVSQMIYQMRNEGRPEDEIQKAVASILAKRVGEAALGGFLSGGAMGGMFIGNQYAQNRRIGRNTDREELSQALENINPESDVAKEYRGKDLTNLKDTEVGALVMDAYAQADKDARAKYQNAVRDSLENLGLSEGEVKDYYDAIFAEKPTKVQKLLRENETIKDIMRDVNTRILPEIDESARQNKYDIAKTVSNRQGVAKALKKSDLKVGAVTELNGEEVKVTDVIKDGDKITVVTNKGEADPAQLTLSAKDANLVMIASGMENNTMRKAYLNNYHGQNVAEYTDSFSTAYSYGKNGVTEENLLEDIGQTINLSIEDATNIYQQGASEIKKSSNEVIETSEEIKKITKDFRKGTFDDSKIDLKKLSASQRGAYAIAQLFTEMGINVSLFNDMSEDSENGYYKDGTVYINLSARYTKQNLKFDRGYVINTMAHELTHWMEDTDSEAFKALKTAIFNYYGEEKTNRLVAQEQQRYEKGTGKSMSKKAAESEVIARACEDMLSDSETLENILLGCNTDQRNTITKKIREFIDKLGEFLNKILHGNMSPSEASRMLRESAEDFERVRKIWAETFTSAVNKVQEDINMLSDAGIEIEGGIAYNQKTLQESRLAVKNASQIKEVGKILESELGVSEEVALNYVNNLHTIASIEANNIALQYEDTGLSSWVSNSDYGGNFDFSYLCPKRLVYTGTVAEIRKHFNKILNPTRFLAIRRFLIDAGHEAPCTYCYVESRRVHSDSYIQDFLDKNPQYGLTLAQLTNADELEKLRREWIETGKDNGYRAYEKAMNSLSQRSFKALEKRRAYRGEILNHKEFNKSEVERINRNRGLRFFAFSDFEVPHLLDLMQIITDMSVRRLAGFAYTKQANFVEVFGGTGLKINMSCVAKGVDENGKIIFDDVEGMNSSDAIKLRQKYSKDVGIVCVVFTDEQVKAAMADDRIDYILPFHSSGFSKDMFSMMGLPSNTKDFTVEQTEKWGNETTGNTKNKKEKLKIPVSDFWDDNLSGRENAQRYLDIINANGYTPLFRSALDHVGGKEILTKDGKHKAWDGGKWVLPEGAVGDGYYKLLIEQKMYDNDGNPSPQRPVLPDFDMEAAIRITTEFDENPNTFPVAHDVVDKFLEWEKNGEPLFSNKVEAIPDKTYDEMKKHFGETTNYNVGGYILKDGAMLDFSGKHWGSDGSTREVDHRDIQEVLPDKNNGYDSVIRMVNNGNIRLKPEIGGIEISQMPTPTQEIRLSRYIQYHLTHGYKDITVDYDNMGTKARSDYYDSSYDAKTILNDIKNYYRGGNQSDLMKFHTAYSAKVDSEGRELTDAQARYFMYSQVRDENGKLKVMYHGTETGGFTIFNRSDDSLKTTGRHPMYFFTDNAEVAESYSGTDIRWNPDEPMSFDELKSAFRGATLGYFEENEDGTYSLYPLGYDAPKEPLETFKTLKEARNFWYDQFLNDTWDEDDEDNATIYQVYIDAANPLRINANIHVTENTHSINFVKNTFSWGVVARAFAKDGEEPQRLVKSIKKNELEDYVKRVYPTKYEQVLKALNKMSQGESSYFIEDEFEDDFPSSWDDIAFNGTRTKTRDIAEYAIDNGYDSVIIDNLEDTGGYGSHVDSSQVVIVFDSNQVKSIYNENPTENEDIRYSIKDDGFKEKDSKTLGLTNERIDKLFSEKVNDPIAEILGLNKELEKQNAKLKADVARLNRKLSLQSKVTKGAVMKESDLDTVAKMLLRSADSKADKAEVIKGLKDVYGYILDKSADGIVYETMMGKAYDVAKIIMDNAKPQKIYDDYMKMILDDIRSAKIKLTDEQKQEVRNAYDVDAHKAFFGRLNITDNGRSLDSYWSEWASMYPDVFDESVNPNDQILELSQIYDTLKEGSTTLQQFNTYSDIMAMAEEVYDKFWNIRTETTVADKYANEIKRINFEHRQAMQEVREQQSLLDDMYYGRKMAEFKRRDVRKDKEIEKLKKQYGKTIAKLREQRDQREADVKAYMKKKEAQRKDNAQRRKLIVKITDTSTDLMERLIKNSAKNPVPKVIREPLTNLLNAIDFSSKTLLGIGGAKAKRGTETKADQAISYLLNRLNQGIMDMQKGADINEDGTDKNEMKNLFAGFHLPPNYTEDLQKIANALQNAEDAANQHDSYTLNLMTTEDLATLYKVLKGVKTAIYNLNKIISTNNAHEVDYIGNEIMTDLDELGQKMFDNKAFQFIEVMNKTPYYYFKHLGKGGQELFSFLQNGWDILADNVETIKNFTHDTYNAEEVKKWDNHINEFEVLVAPTAEQRAKGKEGTKRTIYMTDAQIMSLYCLSKREQGMKHIGSDGIIIDEITTKNKVGVQNKKIAQQDVVRLSPTDLQKILSVVENNERMKTVADAIQKFMNTTCSDWGNYVTMKLYGIEAFTEKNYFPIEVNKDVLNSEAKEKGASIYGMLNQSFTKPLNDKAKNEIYIANIFDVFMNHSQSMAKYNSLALPILDVIKVWNYKEVTEDVDDRQEVKGVKKSITKALGKSGNSYIAGLLRDLNGDSETGRYDQFFAKFGKRYKTAAVAANVQTALLQPLAYLRAAYVIDKKYLARALLHPEQMGKKNIEKEINKVGVWKWKDMGFYDTNLNIGLDKIIRNSDTFGDKVVDKSLWLTEAMDNVTWSFLYKAVEIEQREKMHLTGEALDKAVATRMRDIIYASQVFDSTLSRSAIMRSKSQMNQILTAFMAEPTLSLNMLNDAATTYVNDYKNAYTKARKAGKEKSDARAEAIKAANLKDATNVGRAMLVYLISSIVESVLRGVIGKIRNYDDDDEAEFEGIWKDIFNRVLHELNPLEKLPYIKDIFSAFKGYSQKNINTAYEETLYQTYKAIVKATKTGNWTYKTYQKIFESISQLTGLPVSNVAKEIKTLYNNTIGRATGNMWK